MDFTAEALVRKLDKIRNGRQELERQWKINLAFYRGKQYTFYNTRSRRIESLPVGEGEKPRYRVRLVSNQILPGSQSLLAKLTKTKPSLYATPSSSDDDSIKAASVADSLLEYFWTSLSLPDKDRDALLWGIICCNGYMKVSWNPEAGTPVTFMLSPDGQPILQPAVKEYFREELTKQGIDPKQFEKTVYMGDMQVDVLSPFQVFPDDTVRKFDDAKWAFCSHPMTPEAIKAKFKVDVKPDAMPMSPDHAVPMGSYTDSVDKTVKQVYYFYHIPTAEVPKGKYIVFIDNPNQILAEANYPYPFSKLPLVRFPGLRTPDTLYDTSVVEQAVPIQKELNRTLSQIVEWKNITLRPQYIAPTGSLRQRVTDEPGAIFEYNPIGNAKPEPLQVQALPADVRFHLEDLKQRLDQAFFRNEVSQGQVPPGIEAGIAIDLLQETATDAIAPLVEDHEKSLELLANLLIQMAQKFYVEPRLIQIKGASGQKYVEHFTRANLSSGISVKCETGSSLPRTRAGRQARVMQLVSMGILPPDKSWKYLDLADLKSLQTKFQQDEDQAGREHDKLMKGEPLNPVALQQAMMQANSGEVDPQQAQEMVAQAAVSPNAFDNHAVHVDVHGTFLKSIEFEALPPEVQQPIIQHFELHMQALSEQAASQQPMVPVRTSLQLKGTVGPTGAAQIIKKSGVPEITPEIMLEPPLDTMVIDNEDKPNADDSENVLYTEMDRSDAAHEQKMLHNEELQAQKLRFAKENQDGKASGTGSKKN